jgi:PhnB protein
MKIASYLHFNGDCEAAFNFYKSIFGGTFGYVGRYKDMPLTPPVSEADQNKIMHMSYEINKQISLCGDDLLESLGTIVVKGNKIVLHISAETEEETKRIYNSLSEGGKIDKPLGKVFWGDLFGIFVDKFGVPWQISYTKPEE